MKDKTMIEREYVVSEANEILEEAGKSELEFLRDVVPRFTMHLLEQPRDYWKNYGAYFWNLIELIKHNDPRGYREYVQYRGGESMIGSDEEIRAQYDYRNDMLNWTAAQMYIEERAEKYELGANNPHLVMFMGKERRYIPSVGFIEEDTEGDNELL